LPFKEFVTFDENQENPDAKEYAIFLSMNTKSPRFPFGSIDKKCKELVPKDLSISKIQAINFGDITQINSPKYNIVCIFQP
jgi:hypothetical protein